MKFELGDEIEGRLTYAGHSSLICKKTKLKILSIQDIVQLELEEDPSNNKNKTVSARVLVIENPYDTQLVGRMEQIWLTDKRYKKTTITDLSILLNDIYEREKIKNS